jgi:phosphoribosylglycinamide formyltransferase-1
VPGAQCLDRARQAEIEAVVLDHHQYPTREAFDEALIALLKSRQIEVVVLAGFMRLLTPRFLEEFKHGVINVHPALLPAFPGMHAVQQALDYGVKVTGCTVHFVDEGTDTGPIIAQATVAVRPTDDQAALQQRIHREEHLLFPQIVWQVARGLVTVTGRQVKIAEGGR